MQRNRFLGDLLSQLFDRRGIMRGKEDQRDIYMLCGALLSAEGEVSGLRLASSRCCQTNENSHRIAGAALIYALNSWRHSVRAAVRLILKLSRE